MVTNVLQLINELVEYVKPRSGIPDDLDQPFIAAYEYDASSIKREKIIEFFTSDGFFMLENVFSQFLKSLNLCNIGSISCEFFTCGDCKKFYHLK